MGLFSEIIESCGSETVVQTAEIDPIRVELEDRILAGNQIQFHRIQEFEDFPGECPILVEPEAVTDELDTQRRGSLGWTKAEEVVHRTPKES